MKRQRHIYTLLTLITLLTVTAEAAETDGITSIAYSCKIYEEIEDKFYIGRVLLQYFTSGGDTVVRITGFEEEKLLSNGFYARYFIHNQKLVTKTNDIFPMYFNKSISSGSFSRLGRNFQMATSIPGYAAAPYATTEIEFLNEAPYSIKNLANHLVLRIQKDEDNKELGYSKILYFREFKEIKGWGWVMAFSIIFMLLLCFPIPYLSSTLENKSLERIGDATFLTGLITLVHFVRIIYIFWGTVPFPVFLVPVYLFILYIIIYPHVMKLKLTSIKAVSVIAVIFLVLSFMDFAAGVLNYFFYFGTIALYIDTFFMKFSKNENLKEFEFFLSLLWMVGQQAPFLLPLFCPLNLWYIPNGQTWGLFYLHLGLWIVPYVIITLLFYNDFFCGSCEGLKKKEVKVGGNRSASAISNIKKFDSLDFKYNKPKKEN